VHWRLLTRLLHSPVVVWSWFCDIKITIPPPIGEKAEVEHGFFKA
jgi:hypothetical protein